MTEKPCGCENWGRGNFDSLLILDHHPMCHRYRPEMQVRELLLRLIEGIEEWAADEDGVHPACWDAYTQACCVVNQCERIKETKSC